MPHSCEEKAQVIVQRTGMALGHDEITYLCNELGFTDSGQFWAWMNSLVDEELRREIQRLLEKRRKRLMEVQEVLEIAYIA